MSFASANIVCPHYCLRLLHMPVHRCITDMDSHRDLISDTCP